MQNEEKSQVSSNRVGIIRTVQTPLGFFVLVVLVVEAMLGTIAYTSNGQNTTFALLGMVVILALLIAVVAWMAYYRPEALTGRRPPAPDSPIQATVVYPPDEKDRYNKLFDGFSDCDFLAFNPPFAVERMDKVTKEALRTHKRRYASNVRSRYLFFDKKSYDNAERFFSELAKRIGQDKVDQNIERVYWESAPEAPGYTFFVGTRGTKEKKAVVVLYPKVAHTGVPEVAIHIEGAQPLLTLLRSFFEKQYEAAKHSA